MNDLLTTFEVWLQGKVNVCVDGLLSRTSRNESNINIAFEDIHNVGLNVQRIDDFVIDRARCLENLEGRILALEDKMLDLINHAATRKDVEDLREGLDKRDVEDEVEVYLDKNLETYVKDLIRDELIFEVKVC